MNKMAMFFCLLLSVGIVTSYCQSEQTNEVIQSNPSNALKTPFNTKLPADRSGLFDIELKIDEVDKDQYDLSATIELEGESYVNSPFSKDEIYGHFEISIEETDKFQLTEQLIESPNSVEEYDPIVEMPVRFVRENTTYKQRLSKLSQNDFEVAGLIEFVLEPSCVPYDVTFTISNNSGVLAVKKMKTSISKEYRW